MAYFAKGVKSLSRGCSSRLLAGWESPDVLLLLEIVAYDFGEVVLENRCPSVLACHQASLPIEPAEKYTYLLRGEGVCPVTEM